MKHCGMCKWFTWMPLPSSSWGLCEEREGRPVVDMDDAACGVFVYRQMQEPPDLEFTSTDAPAKEEEGVLVEVMYPKDKGVEDLFGPSLRAAREDHLRAAREDQLAPGAWEDALDIVLAQLRDLMVAKHSDYGPGNIDALGERGIFVRVWDKVNRLKRLVWEDRRVHVEETVEDTWTDLANYGVIALMVKRGWWGLPFGGDEE